MAMYIVTIWNSIDLGDVCYEYEEKLVIPEYDMGELEGMDVKSVELMD